MDTNNPIEHRDRERAEESEARECIPRRNRLGRARSLARVHRRVERRPRIREINGTTRNLIRIFVAAAPDRRGSGEVLLPPRITRFILATPLARPAVTNAQSLVRVARPSVEEEKDIQSDGVGSLSLTKFIPRLIEKPLHPGGALVKSAGIRRYFIVTCKRARCATLRAYTYTFVLAT